MHKPIPLKFPAGMANDGRPKILMTVKDLSGTINEAEAALLHRGSNIYQMNGRLTQLVRHNATGDEDCTEETIDSDEAVRRPSGTLVIEEVGSYRLMELLSEAAHFYKWDNRAKSNRPDPDDPDKKGAWKEARPTIDIARHIEERGQWILRVLRGSVEAPTLRRDGSILQTPGYDRRSQLFFDPDDSAFPAVAKEPTRADALRGLDMLKQVIRDFPFVPAEREEWGGPTAARSVALSLMLTALVRRSLGTAPAHAVIAPTPGTGKTKLAEVAAVLATGRTPTSISYGKSQEEFEKRLFSVLLSGDAVVIVDNIEAEQVSSDEFCTVLTSESVKNRILGVSKMAEVPTSALFILNGNNISFAGDIVDRVVACNLDARMEDPKQRRFDFEPVSYALAHRGELVAAGLTILRAHVAAGFPGAEQLTPSRFPDWDRTVRAALVWMGEPDPQTTRDRIAVADPERDVRVALMSAWREGRRL
ncbi:MAG: hypothetical protein ABL879_18555 [Devosia sp.]